MTPPPEQSAALSEYPTRVHLEVPVPCTPDKCSVHFLKTLQAKQGMFFFFFKLSYLWLLQMVDFFSSIIPMVLSANVLVRTFCQLFLILLALFYCSKFFWIWRLSAVLFAICYGYSFCYCLPFIWISQNFLTQRLLSVNVSVTLLLLINSTEVLLCDATCIAQYFLLGLS